MDVDRTLSKPDRAKVLYLGLPLGALALLRDGHALVAACVSRTRAPGMRRLRRIMAEARGLVLGRPDLGDPSVVEILRSTAPDLVVSWFWTRKIPAEVIGLGSHAFGVHPSLLPLHRGPDPYFWALARGDTDTGVTAHELAPEYDEGGILAQRVVSIPADYNAWQLARLLDRPSLMLLREITARYARGETVEATPQDTRLATDAHAPSDDDCELIWDWPAEDLLARIRAAAPEPGAFTGFGEDTIVVTRAGLARRSPPSLEPGDVALTSEGVVVRAADDAIVLLTAHREGDDRVFHGSDVVALFPGIVKV
jgi:methionyl-tRNA formyltransferase